MDGVSSADAVAAGRDILAPYQTTAADRAYWTPNNSGAWTLATYYDSNTDVAKARGQLSGAALAGDLNKGKRFYALSGDTVAGAKTWYPAEPGAEINVSGAPWFWLGDGTNRDTEKTALLAYCTTASLAGIGGTLVFGTGTFKSATKIRLPANWGMRGMGVGSIIDQAVVGDPVDTIDMPHVQNLGGASYSKISNLRIKNPWANGIVPVWAASTAYTVGQYRYPTRCSNVILKCTVAGTSGAYEPIGELSNQARIKCVGESLAAAQTLLIPQVAGYLGTFAFKLSVDAGVTQSSTVTTAATTTGEPQTYIVDTILGGSTYGPTYGFKISNQPHRVANTTTTADFAQPAVYTTGAPVAVTVSVASSAQWVAGDYLLGSTGGLWMISSVINGTSVSLWNIGANGAAAPTTVIPSGTTLTLCHAPAPRIEVLGTPPSSGYMVDLQGIGGPLGSAACEFQIGKGNPTERWKTGATFGSGAFQTTSSGATYSYAIPATSLTLKFHAGLMYNNGSWSYFTPSQTWSEAVGTSVVDGGATWQILEGVACLDFTGYFCTAEDLFFDGGTFSVKLNQCECNTFQGNFTYTNYRSAGIWALGGSITNALTLSGSHAFFGGSPSISIIHDGGLAFSAPGVLTFQGGASFCMQLAGVDGVNISNIYLESTGARVRNSEFFSRFGTGFSVSNLAISGGYMGSASTASSIDFYNATGVSINGVSLGGTSYGLSGVGTCRNFCVTGCVQLRGNPTFDAWPLSGSGFIRDGSTGKFYQIGNQIKSSTPHRTFSGTTDTVLESDDCGNVTSTGGSGVAVTVGTQSAGHVVTYEQEGAGALSFSASGVTIQTALPSGGATTAPYQTRTLFWKTATIVRIT